MEKFLPDIVINSKGIRLMLCFTFWMAFNTQANDKCQLPLKYLKESTEYQTNSNIKLADEYFDIALSLHKVLAQDCDSNTYHQSMNTLIKQHSVNQRALCASGVRRDCFKNTNRITKFGE